MIKEAIAEVLLDVSSALLDEAENRMTNAETKLPANSTAANREATVAMTCQSFVSVARKLASKYAPEGAQPGHD